MRTFKSRLQDVSTQIDDYMSENLGEKHFYDLSEAGLYFNTTIEDFQMRSLVKIDNKWWIIDEDGDKWEFSNRNVDQKAEILDAIIFDIPAIKTLNTIKEEKGEIEWDD